jgi:hypothetical protein
MAIRTNSKADSNTTSNSTNNSTSKRPWADKNRNGRIDLDDLLIGIRETFQWVFSWRGAMLVCGGFTLFAASVNVAAWVKALSSLGASAPIAGFLTWGTLQVLELMPVLDDLNINASISALIRMQRKPLEIPLVNEDLNPHAKTRFKRYRNREKNREMIGEFVRYACYGLELAILVVGGGILSPTGISWGAVLMALIGIVGVELGLRKANECGEKLMTSEEREFLNQLKLSAKNTSVTLDH